MKLHVLAIGLAIGLIVSTFAQQKEPSRAQIVAEPGGTTGGSSALKPIDKAALRAAVDATAEKLLVPGAVVILSTPQSEFTVSYGTTTLGTTGPPRADTHFRIASNTKTMTAAVIVQLAQEGRLDLDDPVSKYVSGVPDGDQITIADLLKRSQALQGGRIFKARAVRADLAQQSRGDLGVIAESVLNRALSGVEETQSADFAGPNPLFERFGQPDVVAIEADEVPADRGRCGRGACRARFALGARLCRAASISTVPRSRSVTCSRGMSHGRSKEKIYPARWWWLATSVPRKSAGKQFVAEKAASPA